MHENRLEVREKNIYHRLQDDESKQVFAARKKYAQDKNDLSFANVFVNHKELQELVSTIKEKTYIIFGASISGMWLSRYLQLIGYWEKCVEIWDNNRHDITIGGKYVCKPPKTFDVKNVDCVLIAVMSDRNADSIVNDLTTIGCPMDKIVSVSKFGYTLGKCVYESDIQYFDDKIILPKLQKNEIFIDAGCFNFATSGYLLEFAPSVKKIFAFEPDSSKIEWIKHGMEYHNASEITELYNMGLWHKKETLRFKKHQTNPGADCVSLDGEEVIEVTSLDECLKDEKESVTFIKMDIEGSELEALKGGIKIIKRDKPKLAISIYHKPLDYLEIAEFICSLVPEYKLYMRHYSLLTPETVLYGVI